MKLGDEVAELRRVGDGVLTAELTGCCGGEVGQVELVFKLGEKFEQLGVEESGEVVSGESHACEFAAWRVGPWEELFAVLRVQAQSVFHVAHGLQAFQETWPLGGSRSPRRRDEPNG